MVTPESIKKLNETLALGRPLLVGEVRGVRKTRLSGTSAKTGKAYDMRHFVFTVEIGDVANLRSVTVKQRIADDVEYDTAKVPPAVKRGAIVAFLLTGVDSGSREGQVWESSEVVAL